MSENGAPLIRLRGLSREFVVGGHVVHALRPTDLEIRKGEFVAIMGPSGSGKSTLLNLLGCLDRATAGTYELEGREVTQVRDSELVELRRNRIGFIFQSFHLVPRMTALRNVELPLIFAGETPKERRRRAEKELRAVGLEHRLDHRPNQLSGGERQRVAIARALVTNPAVLLADEPTGNLDEKSGEEIIELIQTLHRSGRTILMVTHNPELASLTERILRMRDGWLGGPKGDPA
jgi:putative ABC transport system ATP-binding protein